MTEVVHARMTEVVHARMTEVVHARMTEVEHWGMTEVVHSGTMKEWHAGMNIFISVIRANKIQSSRPIKYSHPGLRAGIFR